MALSPTTTLHLDSPERLVKMMSDAGLSTRTLASRIGSSPARIGQLGRGHKPETSAVTALAIAAELDVDVRELFSFPDGAQLVALGLI